MTKEEYNEVPIHYCKNCLSLSIVRLNSNPDGNSGRRGNRSGVDYCYECGSGVISKTHIYVWVDMYEEYYGEPFLIRRGE